MSKSVSKHLYFPTNLKIEIKPFLNGYIIWFSSYIYVLKKIIFSSVNINARKKEHQLYFYLKNYYLNFSFFGNNVTQTLKKENLKLFFYGTAIAKKGNDRHT